MRLGTRLGNSSTSTAAGKYAKSTLAVAGPSCYAPTCCAYTVICSSSEIATSRNSSATPPSADRYSPIQPRAVVPESSRASTKYVPGSEMTSSRERRSSASTVNHCSRLLIGVDSGVLSPGSDGASSSSSLTFCTVTAPVCRSESSFNSTSHPDSGPPPDPNEHPLRNPDAQMAPTDWSTCRRFVGTIRARLASLVSLLYSMTVCARRIAVTLLNWALISSERKRRMARAGARFSSRQHRARDERPKGANRLGRFVALCGAVRCGCCRRILPGGLKGRDPLAVSEANEVV
mgnify:CR=1 FL=1